MAAAVGCLVIGAVLLADERFTPTEAADLTPVAGVVEEITHRGGGRWNRPQIHIRLAGAGELVVPDTERERAALASLRPGSSVTALAEQDIVGRAIFFVRELRAGSQVLVSYSAGAHRERLATAGAVGAAACVLAALLFVVAHLSGRR